MKREIALSLALALLSLTSFAPTALGHQRKKPVAFTGVVTPGEG